MKSLLPSFNFICPLFHSSFTYILQSFPIVFHAPFSLQQQISRSMNISSRLWPWLQFFSLIVFYRKIVHLFLSSELHIGNMLANQAHISKAILTTFTHSKGLNSRDLFSSNFIRIFCYPRAAFKLVEIEKSTLSKTFIFKCIVICLLNIQIATIPK